MPKPVSRKQKIRKKASDKVIEVQRRKIIKLSKGVVDLEKRLKKLEEKGGGPA